MNMKLLGFDEDGLLPPGDYSLTFDELRRSILVSGPKPSLPDWDLNWRLNLTNNLEKLVEQLWSVGIENIFIDGSFVEAKEHPNDIDGYFECDLLAFASGKLQRDLNSLDPFRVWTWDIESRWCSKYTNKPQLPMWHQYGIELYPHYNQSSGIKDKFGYELQFPSAFRLSRRGDRARGIIRIIKEAQS
jgi:hypothetical protein